MKSPFLKLLLCGVLLLAGCAYYNTFFNAKKFFKEAAQERAKRKTDKPTPRELEAYKKAIEKASRLLELYPKSKYVDDALFLLGEVFFHQEEYGKAKRKFEELLGFFPQSDFAPEAKLWLGKTHLRLKEYVLAERNFRELLAAKPKREITDESQFLLGDLFFEQEDYDAAIEEYGVAAEKAKDKKIRAQAYFQLGECYLKIDNYQKASQSFRRALKFSPDEKFKFNARFKLALSQKLVGGYDEAIKTYSKLLKDESNRDQWPKIELEIADCIYSRGSIQEAVEWYESIIEEYSKSDAAARAYFHLGRIYERDFLDYPKAKENYDKVRSEYSRSEVVSEANAKSANLGELLKLTKAIREQEMKLAQGVSDTTAADTTAEKTPEPNPEPVAEDSIKTAVLADSLQPKPREENTEDKITSQREALAKNKLKLAELFLFQFSQPDSALLQYMDILEFYSETQSASKALYSVCYVFDKIQGNSVLADSLYKILIKKYPDSPQAQEARARLHLPSLAKEEEEASLRFREAEKELWERGNIQAALEKYRRIVEDFPESELAPKAVYALGWIYEFKLKSNEEAYQTYQRLIQEYPTSQYAKKVKAKVTAVENKSKVTPAESEVKEPSQVSVPYDSRPEPVGGVEAIQRKLVYPEIARKAGVEGEVIIEVLVDEKGNVVDTKVLKSLGDNGCDEAAIAAIKSVEWRPAKQRDRPVKVWAPIPVIFKLK